jgi:RNA polymerase sigma-70 factor (ECF subfamily)
MTVTVDSPKRPTAEVLLGEAGFVHALARALLRDAGLAHDVAQDALVAALQQQVPPRQWRAWLTAVTQRLAGAARRERAARARHEAAAARRADTDRDDDGRRTAERLQLHRRLCELVLALPEPYRTAVTLRFLDGLPPRAIARKLGRDAATVRQHVHRGLLLLRQRLDGEFGARDRWRAAFAASGLGAGGTTAATLLPVLLMKKILFAAALLLATGSVWWWRAGDAVAPPGAAHASAATAAMATAPGAVAGARESAAPAADANAPARTAVAFAVRVVDDDDHPIGGVTVRCWRRTGDAVVASTGADGRTALPADDGAGALRIEAPSRPPLVQRVEPLLGEHKVVLARGSELSGRVLVDGAPAPAGLRLSLSSGSAKLPEGLPANAVKWLERNAWRDRGETRTDAGGAFAFTGLQADWEGGVSLPWTHWVVPQPGQRIDPDVPRFLPLQGPQRGLVVFATRLQVVAGRVVWADDGSPVPEPDVGVYAEFADGDNTPISGIAGDADGRFAMGLAPGSSGIHDRWLDPARRPAVARVVIDCYAPRAHFEFGAEALQDGRELVLCVARPPRTWFRAVDERGAPIAGALAELPDGKTSDPTDADGLRSFAGKTVRAVGAPGRMVVPGEPRAKAAGSRDDPLVFVLEPVNRLAIRLRTEDGGVPAARRVVLQAAVDLFAGHRLQVELDQRFGSSQADCMRKGTHQADGSTRWTESSAIVTADANGEIVLQSLAAGTPCTIVVRDAVSAELARTAIDMPAAGESRGVELVIPGAPRHIRGRVLDENSSPIATVQVRLQAPGGNECYATTDRDGAFAFDCVYAEEPLQLAVAHAGFAPQIREGIARDRDGEPVEFRLLRGNTVHVTVRDAEDRPVAATPQFEGPVREFLHPQAHGAGDLVFQDLPTGTVTFATDIGGTRFELRHDTAVPEAVLRVPTPARVAIALPPGNAAPANGSLVVQVTRLDAAMPARDLDPDVRDPAMLLPGRYRFELVARTFDDGHAVHTPLGLRAEAELRAGATTTVTLQ